MREYFGFKVHDGLVREWKTGGVVQVINSAEIYPIWIAYELWKEKIRGRKVIFFVDNNSAKDSIIRGLSTSECGDWLVRSIMASEMGANCQVWYARVPSASNIADEPSRLRFEAFVNNKLCIERSFAQPCSFEGGVPRFQK